MRTLCISLVMLAACARDDARPSTPAPSTPAPQEPAAKPSRSDPAPMPQTDPPPEATAPAPAATVRLVDVDPDAGSLREQIVAAAAQAKADGRTVAVELWAGWCPPCKKLDQLLRSGPVAAAVGNAVLIRVDTDVFNEELSALGFDAPQIPSLYRLDDRGRPRGKPLLGAKWSRASETAIAEQLAAFLQG
jgi:thiol-disulfide isomerase/thioredoxin